MLKFSFHVPEFIIRWLFPTLIDRALIHGKASASKRSKSGFLEVTATMEKADD